VREGVRITATPRIGKTRIADCGLRIADFIEPESSAFIAAPLTRAGSLTINPQSAIRNPQSAIRDLVVAFKSQRP